MKNKFINLILVIISFLILIFFEEYTYKLFRLVNFNVNNFTPSIQIIINLAIRIFMCIIIFLIFRKQLKRRKRIKTNLIKKILIVFVGISVIIASMYLLNFLFKILNINIIKNNYYNIFIEKINLDTFCFILNNYIINPYLYCTIIILSTNKLIKNKTYSMITSGIIAGILYYLILKGNIQFIIYNLISIIIVYMILSVIYNKTNNMWLSILIRIFYPLVIIILANYFKVFI